MFERLQKILSARGIASRRKAEEYIAAGLVTVNGKIAKVGDKADSENDVIEVDGKVLEARQKMLYYVMHKPVGVLTSLAEQEYSCSTVRDLLPSDLRGKICPVGRLDKDSSGLLLFTNDGVLAYRLTHPKFDHEKEYEIETERPVTPGQIRKLEEGITIAGQKTKPARVAHLAPRRFRIAITEGRYRQIRRMCQKVGCPVRTLRRVRIMTLTDMKLKPGEMRELTGSDRAALLRSVGL